jgi:hypothetical protein
MPDAAKPRGPLTIAEQAGARFVEGPLGQPFMQGTQDAALILEACFSNRAGSALLYASNLTTKFFDLSSGEAGAILQKLRDYRIRLAIIHTQDSPPAAGLPKWWRKRAEAITSVCSNPPKQLAIG